MRPNRCGTDTGYRNHQHAGEKPCDACATAKREYDKRYRSASERTQRSRLAAKAQNRAYRRLAKAYPDLYAALYAEEKEAAFRDAGIQPRAVRSW